MKRLFTMLMLAFVVGMTCQAQAWKEWDSHDIRGFYVEIDEDDAEDYDDAEEFGGRWFIPTRIPSGEYSVEMGEKVESRFWRFNGTKYFVHFRFTPFLWKWDEGVLVSEGRKGVFYEKPD